MRELPRAYKFESDLGMGLFVLFCTTIDDCRGNLGEYTYNATVTGKTKKLRRVTISSNIAL